MRSFIRFFAVILIGFLMLGAAPVPFVGAMYTSTKTTITLTWDPVQNATRYNVRLVFLDGNTSYPAVSVNQPTATFSRPRAGHFRVDVQAVNSAGVSAWSRTTDATVARVGTDNMAWQIYWRLPAPGGVIIE